MVAIGGVVMRDEEAVAVDTTGEREGMVGRIMIAWIGSEKRRRSVLKRTSKKG
jgi:hypothetical protein